MVVFRYDVSRRTLATPTRERRCGTDVSDEVSTGTPTYIGSTSIAGATAPVDRHRSRPRIQAPPFSVVPIVGPLSSLCVNARRFDVVLDALQGCVKHLDEHAATVWVHLRRAFVEDWGLE